MANKTLLLISLTLFSFGLFSQAPGGGSAPGAGAAGGGKFKMMKIGHLYGKILDAKTKEALPYTPVAVLKKDSVVGGCITKENGEFSIENLPFGKFTVKIATLGYEV